jgi:hypothetical protein
MAGKTAILSLKILGDAKDAQKALDDTSTSAGKLQSGVTSAAVPAAAALAGLAAAGISAAQAAAEDEASQAQLALALKNSTGASKAQVAQTEDWISKTSKATAVADDELRPALATLARATGDVEESQKAMGVALDVSAATGKDTQSVSEALAKAYAGNTASLGKLVPGMDKAILASGDMDAIMGELARTTGGAAAEAANTTAGQMEGMKIQMAEAQEAIGGALLPAMSSLAKMLAVVATWVQENSRLFLIVGGVIGGFAAAILVANVAIKAYGVITKIVSAATKVWAAVQWLLNSAFLASPITWIVLAVIALVAVIVLIATKTTWFQDIWNAAWGAIQAVAVAVWEAIQSAAGAVWDWIVSAAQAAWKLIAAIFTTYVKIWVRIIEGIVDAAKAVWNWVVDAAQAAWRLIVAAVQFYINIYVAIFNTIKAAVGAVWNWISDAASAVWNLILGAVRGFVATFLGIWEGIKSGLAGVWSWLETTARNVLNAILGPIRAIDSAFDNVVSAIRSVIDWLGRIKIPDALKAAGDLVGKVFGRSAPASKSVGTSAAVAPAGARAFAAPSFTSSSDGGGTTIVVQGALDPVAVARQIRQILTGDQRRRAGVVIA